MEESSSTFLGLDLGTSGLRALLTDATGNPIASAQAKYTVENPFSGWSEQDPNHWVNALKRVIKDLNASNPAQMSTLAGLATAGHMHGATILDADGKVLRPCILWNDTRSHEQAADLDAIPEFRDISGNIVFPGFTAPKLAWIKKNEPDIFAEVATVLLPKDYLTYWLTGRRVSDMSDSAGTSWLNIKTRDWSDDLLRLSGMKPDQMPHLFEGSDPIGPITTQRANELGLPDTVTVVAGAADNAAAACGIGVLDEGQGFVSLGTSGVLLAGKAQCAPLPASAVHTFCHAVPNAWYQMGVILSATDCLNWLSRILGHSQSHLAGLLTGPLKPPSSITFLPYLSGERTPHNNSTIRGAFVGLDVTTSQSDMVQAVFEGVAFALRDNLEALKSTGTDLKKLFAIGGGAQSQYWLSTLATVLNVTLLIPDSAEFGAASGAARLAICGTTSADPNTVMTPPEIAAHIHPEVHLRAEFEAAYHRFCALYSPMKEHFS